MPGSYVKRVNTGPLSDSEVEYNDYDTINNTARPGWSWRWGGLPKKGLQATMKSDDTPSRMRRDRTKSAEPLRNMTVDEKVNNYLAGLPEVDKRSYSPQESEGRSSREQSPEPVAVPAGPKPGTFTLASNTQMDIALANYEKIRLMSPEVALQKNDIRLVKAHGVTLTY